jgi:L-threonylcarbamoyladenylate synthase
MNMEISGNKMKIIKIDQKNPKEKILKMVVKQIKLGKIIAYPTDTLYGLCTNPFNKDSIKKIFKIKKRDPKKGLPILIGETDFLNKLAFIDNKIEKFINKFWPGSLTLILKKKPFVPDSVTGGNKTIAIRQPNSKLARYMANLSYGFIIGTSANKSGSKNNPINTNVVLEELDEEIDYVLDGGETELKKSSTIIDFTGKKPQIMREGYIKVIELNDLLK